MSDSLITSMPGFKYPGACEANFGKALKDYFSFNQRPAVLFSGSSASLDTLRPLFGEKQIFCEQLYPDERRWRATSLLEFLDAEVFPDSFSGTLRMIFPAWRTILAARYQ